MNPGMSPEVQQAIQRRGGAPTPQLSQVSAGAPMQSDIPMSPMNPSDLQGASLPSASTGAAQSPQKYQPQNQTDLVIMSLTEFLKNEQSLKKEQLKMSAPMGM